jgi:hypothetical protein
MPKHQNLARQSTYLKPIDPNARWTYRSKRDGQTVDKHYSCERDAIHAAINSIEAGSSLPVHIRADERVVYEVEEIMNFWADKFLGG